MLIDCNKKVRNQFITYYATKSHLYKLGVGSHRLMAVLHHFLASYRSTHNADKILKLIILVHSQLRNNTVEFQEFNKSSCPVVLF